MSRFVIYNDAGNQYRWRLVASNGEIVAASEAYVSKQGAARSAENVKCLASSAEIVDEPTLVSILAKLLKKK